ncbi:zinc finger protein 862-like [Ascaphus truei]|uniref:zinc finger protein 862-like n=1 Tax=Ascaphus truei TaxID=8439 RepID=UPI003F5AB31F
MSIKEKPVETSLDVCSGEENKEKTPTVNHTENSDNPPQDNPPQDNPPQDNPPQDNPPQNERPMAIKLVHKRRNFQVSWLKEFNWLTYDSDSAVASCQICSEFCRSGDCVQNKPIRQHFKSPFKIETFKLHGKSVQHGKCAESLRVQLNPETPPEEPWKKKMEKEMFQQMCVVFNTAYYIAKNNKPFSDMKELLNYARKLGVGVPEQYGNDKRCAEFIKFIAEKIRNDVVAEIKSSPFFSILLDGSTDKSTTEQHIMYIKYCKQGDVKETFVSIVQLKNSTGQGYFDAVQEELVKCGLHWRDTAQVVGLRTDGAASMSGSVNGLTAKMKAEVKHLISVHCAAQKLQLCVLKSVKDAPYISKVDDVLIGLFRFYANSPKRQNELQDVAQSLSANILKVQHIHEVRWVASKVGALKSVLADWKPCVVHMESIVESQNRVESNHCKGFLKMLKNVRFLLTLHFLLDFLLIFKKLSLIFQREKLLLSHVKLHVKNALHSLEELEHTVGEEEKSFLDSTSMSAKFQEVELSGLPQEKLEYQQDRIKLIKTGMKCLNDRFFDNHCEVSTACSIFDTVTWPSGRELKNYGDSEIKAVTRHFHALISKDSLETVTEAILNEWYEVKVLCKHLKLEDILKTESHRERFPFFFKLLSIIAVLPTSTTSCKKGFAAMNLIKSKSRSPLQTSTLDNLMTISINGPAIDLYEPECAIDNWYFLNKTRRERPCK